MIYIDINFFAMDTAVMAEQTNRRNNHNHASSEQCALDDDMCTRRIETNACKSGYKSILQMKIPSV